MKTTIKSPAKEETDQFIKKVTDPLKITDPLKGGVYDTDGAVVEYGQPATYEINNYLRQALNNILVVCGWMATEGKLTQHDPRKLQPNWPRQERYLKMTDKQIEFASLFIAFKELRDSGMCPQYFGGLGQQLLQSADDDCRETLRNPHLSKIDVEGWSEAKKSLEKIINGTQVNPNALGKSK